MATSSANWALLTEHIAATICTEGNQIDGETHTHLSVAFRHAFPGGDFIFKLPPTATTFKTVNTGLQKQASDLGFRKVHSGKFTFFEGTGEADAIKSMIQLGGDIYSFAPSERTSFGGNFAGHIIRRLLYGTFRVSGHVHTELDCSRVPSIRPLTHVPQTFRPGTISGATPGHFLPYFPGLVLPDKATILLFLSIYSRALGNSAELQASTTILLTRGWASLYNTQAGRIISHMVFCINLARTGGFEITATFYKGEYNGCLLFGDSPLIVGTDIVPPRPVEDEEDDNGNTKIGLRSEVISMFGHEQALASICERLSAVPTRKGATIMIAPDDVPTARHLHVLCQERKINQTTKDAIIESVKSLRFNTTLWDAFSDDAILAAVTALNNKDAVDSHIFPFSLQVGALFTKSRTLSILAAFGANAPSPFPEAETNGSMPIRDGFLGKANLSGLPIYNRPIQQAVEDWKTVKKTGAIVFRTKGKDKNGYQRVAGTNKLVNPAAGAIQTQIVKTFIELNNSKKRKRDEEPISEKTAEVNRESQKKSKTRHTGEATSLFETLGI